jgi:hypothetical protein
MIKKFCIVSIIALCIFSSFGTKRVYATLPTFDYANLGQAFLGYIIQGYQYAKDTITAAATNNTSAQTTLQTVNEQVLTPMRDALTLVTIMRTGEGVRNLVLGTNGDALLVTNPRKYIDQKGNEVVRASLGNLAAQKNIYSESVLGSVLDKSRYNSQTLSSKLSIINDPSLKTEQQSRCTDAALTYQAKKDLSDSKGDEYTNEDVTKRKQELNAALCGNLNDKKVQLSLNKIATQSPTWNSWMSLTGGNNAYTKKTLSENAIQGEVATVQGGSKDDLRNGGGIRSQVKCKKRETNNIDGGEYTNSEDAPCIDESIIKSAKVLSDSFHDAIKSPLDTLIASFGSGAGGLVSTAFNTMNIIQQISTNLETNDGGGGSGGSNNTPVITSQTPQNDLAGNQQSKAKLLKTSVDFINDYKSKLATLRGLDNKFITVVNSYQTETNKVKQCFDTLVQDYPEASGDSVVQSATSFYTAQSSTNTDQRVRIQNELNLVSSANTFLDEALARMNASQSTEEILTIFSSLQDKMNDGTLPDITTTSTREGEYVTYKNDLQIAVGSPGLSQAPDADLSQAFFFKMNKSCADTRADYEHRRLCASGGCTGGQ